MRLHRIWLFGIAVAFLLTTTSLFSTTLEELPTPKYDIGIKTHEIIYAELKSRLDEKPEYKLTLANDKQLVGVTYKYFRKYNKWYKEFSKKITTDSFKNNKDTHPGETFDCEDHAMMYKTMMTLATTKTTSPNRGLLVGVIFVYHETPQLGITQTGAHALNLVHTSRGWIVYEPQTGQSCKLTKYKNSIYGYLF